MKVCILGDGLTSLTLAKALVNKGIFVDIFLGKKKINYSKNQTLGISKNNINFFNNHILNIDKIIWQLNKIDIFSQNLKDKKILTFNKKDDYLFSIVRNCELYKILLLSLKKDSLFNQKSMINFDKLKNKAYKIIFNCDPNNEISKKYFNNSFVKDYKSEAFTAVIKHKKVINNTTATQIFTNEGPLAFLPISQNETSIVYSIRKKEKIDFKNCVKSHNKKYSIMSFSKINKFKLTSSNLRNYYKKNILAFGDLLHRLHPLAGQGFNMTLRDIKELLEIVNFKLDHGLDLDNSICIDFEKRMKHKNYLFSNGIDFIYEYFKFENKLRSSFLSNQLKIIGSNKKINSFFTKVADRGLPI